MLSKSLPLALLASLAASSPLLARDPCGSGYTTCTPAGANTQEMPATGSALSNLWVDLVDSVSGIHFSKRSYFSSLLKRSTKNHDKRSASMCCKTSFNCLTLQEFEVPMCYDKFTTNFVLADGSNGNVHEGTYTDADGVAVDLATGDYSSGNIYSADAQEKPNTSTLDIPPQWTGTGVGSAVPITLLATVNIYTTTIPASTISAPTTIPASTVPAKTVPAVTVAGSTTIMPTTIPASTVPATTIESATTIPAKTSVVTEVQTLSSGVTLAASSVSAAGSASGTETTSALSTSATAAGSSASASASQTGAASGKEVVRSSGAGLFGLAAVIFAAL